MNHRPLRVANLIRDELSALILREFEFPGAIVTVTDVAVADKIDTAIVRISVFPNERAEGVLREIRGGGRRLEREILKKINIRPMPHLSFELDQGAENAAKVEKILLDEIPAPPDRTQHRD